jgi:hypothetical protein
MQSMAVSLPDFTTDRLSVEKSDCSLLHQTKRYDDRWAIWHSVGKGEN